MSDSGLTKGLGKVKAHRARMAGPKAGAAALQWRASKLYAACEHCLGPFRGLTPRGADKKKAKKAGEGGAKQKNPKARLTQQGALRRRPPDAVFPRHSSSTLRHG